MSDCSKHLKTLYGESDMKKVAENIGDLNYETLAELTEQLGLKLLRDSNSDFRKGRKKLSISLKSAARLIQTSAQYIHEAWQISKPFMENKS